VSNPPQSGTPSSLPTASGEAGEIFLECVRINSRYRMRNIATHYLVAILPLMLGWSTSARQSNLALVGILLFYATVAISFTYWFNKALRSASLTRAVGRSLYVQMVFVGVMYNLIFYNLHLHGIANAMTYGLVVVTLYAAGGVSSYHTMKHLGMTFVITAMTPQVVYYLSLGTKEGNLFAFIVGVFIVFVSQVSKDIHAHAIEIMMLNRELKTEREKAETLAMTDELSGLPNRRAFIERGRAILAAARRNAEPVSLVMLDIDHFKTVNDSYGHAAGDDVIKEIASILRDSVRESDLVGRIGGEEFAVVLPRARSEESCGLAERIRQKISCLTLDARGTNIGLTASLGVAESSDEHGTLDELLSRADHALYEAKAAGRNRVASFSG